MCSVSYFPVNEGFILTSNRDERAGRETISPKTYQHDNQNIVYPKDLEKGGTWIAWSENKNGICLLNGGFKKHKHLGNYSRSRGEIALERYKFEHPWDFITMVDLENVEPFTVILFDIRESVFLIELIWDGKHKHANYLDPKLMHFWCSSTLYPARLKSARRRMFEEWQQRQDEICADKILEYHNTHFNLKPEILPTNPEVQTVSISQIIHTPQESVMRYFPVELEM
jgi:hypothetical protein